MITRRKFLTTSIGSTVAVSTTPTFSQWLTLPSLPMKVQEIYPALYKNQIIVAGGLYADLNGRLRVSDQVIAFDLETQSWRNLANLPEPRHHPFLINFQDKLFAFSGFVQSANGDWTASTDVLSYDSRHQKFIKMPTKMPFPMCETVATVYGDQIHFVSGRTPASQENGQWRDHRDIVSHQVFEPKLAKWRSARPIQMARNSACSVQIDSKWYVIGGRTVTGGNLAALEVYDFKSDYWETRAPMPQAQGGLAADALGHNIYVFGGEYFDNGGGVYKKVWRYDTKKDKWDHVSDMPVPRHGLGAIAVNNKIYVVGGAAKAGGNETTNRLSVFQPD